MKLGFAWIGFLILSFAFFLLSAFTIPAWFAYIFGLLPLYGLALLVGWLKILKNKVKVPVFNHAAWLTVFTLQALVALTAPGNCYMVNQGNPCYSNLQILSGNVPSSGLSNVPPWTIVEDAFFGFLAAYGVALLVGIWTTKFKTAHHDSPQKNNQP